MVDIIAKRAIDLYGGDLRGKSPPPGEPPAM
jgi:hypothetical protein